MLSISLFLLFNPINKKCRPQSFPFLICLQHLPHFYVLHHKILVKRYLHAWYPVPGFSFTLKDFVFKNLSRGFPGVSVKQSALHCRKHGFNPWFWRICGILSCRETKPVHHLLSLCSGAWAEKALAPHSSTPAWKIPWTEEPGGLQSMGWLRVGHD